MQFKNPEILYALVLLLIPIIIHLFQLRRFKKVDFTNVAFLKKASLQTRKSSEIKKWLVLLTRLLLFAAIIIAFAQPYTSKTRGQTKTENVIYLDNSFSMQAKGNQGELFKRAVQDVIANVPQDAVVSIFTNDAVFKNTTIDAVKNELLRLEYSASQLPYKAALLKSNLLLENNKNSLKNIVFISDFQDYDNSLNEVIDPSVNLHLVKLSPVNTANISVDSIAVSSANATNLELAVFLKNSGDLIDNLPVSLYNDNDLVAKTSVELDRSVSTLFSIPSNTAFKGQIVIDDGALQFDNILYFNLNDIKKINVLAINQADDSFLKRIYTKDEFNYKAFEINQLDYNLISDQQLIILNELDQIPNSLATSLKAFARQGGSILVVPAEAIHTRSYNDLLIDFNIAVDSFNLNEKRITEINFSHPLYANGVFEKQISNFQYPKVKGHYRVNTNKASSALKFENGATFLSQGKNLYLFASPLSGDNSNFVNSPLIVPSLYNIGKYSLKLPRLYYTIGRPNSFDVATQLQQDDILTLVNNEISIIPRQQQYNNKVVIKTEESPEVAGIYSINSKDQVLSHVSFNYQRTESDLTYKDVSNSDQVHVNNSVSAVFDAIKSDTKMNALWKWFVIFALLLLIIEMLILKYFK